MLRGNWSSTITSASAPCGLSSQASPPPAAASQVARNRARISASKPASFSNHLSGPAARQKASTVCGVARSSALFMETSPRLAFAIESQPDRPADDLRVTRGVETHERARPRIVEIDHIRGSGGVKALPYQINLLLLERHRDREPAAGPEEQRPGIVRQQGVKMRAKTREIEVVVGDDCRHAGAAVAARYLDAVHIGVADAGEAVDGLGDLRSRHVLALPAEGVADPVDEIEIAPGVLPHEVAGAEPGITRREHVAQDFPLAVLRVRITLEAVARGGRVVDDSADVLAGLAWRAADAEAAFVA